MNKISISELRGQGHHNNFINAKYCNDVQWKHSVFFIWFIQNDEKFQAYSSYIKCTCVRVRTKINLNFGWQRNLKLSKGSTFLMVEANDPIQIHD